MAEKGGSLDPLLKVDAVALLKSIRDIEHQLSEYHRQDKVPQWGEELLLRLDRVESQRGESSQGMRDRSGVVTLQDLTNDERIIRKVRSDIDSDLNFIKGSCETKVSSLSLEVERLHKLLQSRPTNTELQQVVLSIQHVDSKINESVNDITASIAGIVSARVSEEMEALLRELNINKDSTLDSVNAVSKKIDSFQSDIGNMRNGIQDFQATIQAQLAASQGAIGEARAEVSALQKAFEEDAAAVQQTFAEIKFTQNMNVDTFSDYKATVTAKLLNTEEEISSQRTQLKETATNLEKFAENANKKVREVGNSLEDFKQTYAKDAGETKEKIQEIVECVEDLQTRQTEAEEFLDKIKEFNLFDVVNNIVSNLESHDSKLNSIESSLETISKENLRLVEVSQNVTDELEGVKTTIEEHSERLEKLAEEDTRQDAILSGVNENLQRVEKELSRLSTVSAEIGILRDQLTVAEQRLKTNQTTLSGLSETSNDHDRRIEELIDTLDKNSELESKRMDELRGEMMDMLKQKQAEMEATIQNMKDNVEMITQAQESMGGQRSGRMGRGNMSGRMGGIGGNVAAMDMNAPAGITEEEEKAATEGKAQFVADLAINFEEIAIKKTFVPEIPPAMRKHITTVCQELTAFIAEITDAEMVQRQMQDIPDEMEFYNNIINEMRNKKLDSFLNEVREIVVNHNPQPGIIRHDAREKFMKLVRKALELCMSKHDQVLNIGNSRLGRIKIPTCIACDRPLLEKNRMDTVVKNNDALLRPSVDEDFEEGPHSNRASSSRMNRPKTSSAKVSQSSGSMLKLPSATPVGRNQISDLSVGSHNNSAMVLKSGFKMNKGGEVTKSMSTLPDL